ncbi:MAG: hypothetical protein U5K72_01900 [Balneolaceae bacterium]|nr:hypothetical protein [Balneolaceae bacterium]
MSTRYVHFGANRDISSSCVCLYVAGTPKPQIIPKTAIIPHFLDVFKDILDTFKDCSFYFLSESTSQLYPLGTTTHSRYDYGIINEFIITTGFHIALKQIEEQWFGASLDSFMLSLLQAPPHRPSLPVETVLREIRIKSTVRKD